MNPLVAAFRELARFSRLICCFPVLAGIDAHAQTAFTITQFVGNPTAGETDGVGSEARFASIRRLAIGPEGNLWVKDQVFNGLRKVSPRGDVITVTNLGANTAAGIALDSQGNLFFSVAGSGGIRKRAPDGTVEVYYAGIGPLESLAVDSAGNLFGMDSPRSVIVKITPSRQLSIIAGQPNMHGYVDGPAAQSLLGLVGNQVELVLTPDGSIYFTDTGNHCVRRVSPAGVVSTVAGSPQNPNSVDGSRDVAGLFFPKAVTYVGTGQLIVGELQKLRAINLHDGSVTTVAGNNFNFSNDGFFGVNPLAGVGGVTSLASDSRGCLYIAELNRIRKGLPVQPYLAEPIEGHAGFVRSSDGTYYVASSYAIYRSALDGTSEIVAGHPSESGSVDGNGQTARFADIRGMAMAGDTIYIADFADHTIRRVTLAGEVSTIAGVPGQVGSSDGVGPMARFNQPSGIAVDSAHNLIVPDTGNHTIRKVSPGGEVTTIAGSAGLRSEVDGIGDQARFTRPTGIYTDKYDNAYVTGWLTETGQESRNSPWLLPYVRKVSPAGVVTTIPAGAGPNPWVFVGGFSGGTTGTVVAQTLSSDSRIVVDSEGTIYVGYIAGFNGVVHDDGTIVSGHLSPTSAASPALGIISSSGSGKALAGAELSLSVSDRGEGYTYQWQYAEPGAPTAFGDIVGATTNSHVLATAQTFHSGFYRLALGDGRFWSHGPAMHVEIEPPNTQNNARLVNLSTRAQSLTGDDILIPGFVVSGTGTKQLLIRAVGPTLRNHPYNIATALDNPRMALKRLDFSVNPPLYVDIDANDDWATSPNAAAITQAITDLSAFPFEDDREAALLVDLMPGQYTVFADGVAEATGIAIVELYDADGSAPTATLVNISNRGFVGTGDNVMIPGFVVSSEGPKTLLIRVVGPTLAGAPYNVPGTMVDPKLEIFPAGSNTPILANDNWGDNSDAATTAQIANEVGAFALAAGSADAAFVVTLQPGTYTVVGSAADGTSTGVVLVEIYVVP